MCGIAGMFFEHDKLANLKAATETVEGMLSTLQHRGKSKAPVVQKDNCFLGHARLDIVGGKSGVQPVEVDGICLTFNGEIYNYLDIRTDLINRGRRFKTRGDAEVIAHAYIVYGNIFIEKLKGIFAFALYDSHNRTLMLARDRVGVKPLYYDIPAQAQGGLAFASEIKAFEKERFSCISPEAICEYLHFQFCLGDNTLFNGIHKVEPGEMIIFKEKDYSPTHIKYWKLDPASVKSDSADHYTEKYYTNRLLSMLHKIVRKQSPLNMNFGAYVSGGLDSSTVVSLMSEYAPELKLFTGRYDYDGYDESSYVQDLVKGLPNCDLNVVNITEDDVVNGLQDSIYHMDEPCAGPGLLGQYVLAKAVKAHDPSLKVMVGGQGGDELFGGYARYIIAYLESCLHGAINPDSKDYVMTLDKLMPLMPILKGYEPMLRSFMSKNMFEQKDKRYFDLISRFPMDMICDDFKNTFYKDYKDRIPQKFSKIFSELGSVSYFTKMTYFDFKTSLPALLQVDDRVNGAFEMESRVPLLDEELVDFAFQIPPIYKFAGGYSKGLLRKAMAGVLPDNILWRRDKMGFPIPMQEWIDKKGRLYDMIMDLFSSDFYKSMFNPVDKLEFNRGTWGKISLCMWNKIFKVGLY